MTLQELQDRVEELTQVTSGDTEVFFEFGGLRACTSEITCVIKEDNLKEIIIKG